MVVAKKRPSEGHVIGQIKRIGLHVMSYIDCRLHSAGRFLKFAKIRIPILAKNVQRHNHAPPPPPFSPIRQLPLHVQINMQLQAILHQGLHTHNHTEHISLHIQLDYRICTYVISWVARAH